MIKKSKVTNVQNNGTWEGKFGLMYKFEIDFQNDDCGEYSSKSKDQNKFVIGEEVEYEFIDGKFPKIKPISTFQPNFRKDDHVQKYIIKQSSLKCAVEICIAEGIYSTDDVIARAEVFVDWVFEKEENIVNNNPF